MRKSSIETYREAVRTIRREEGVPPVLFFFGEETFFLDLLQDEITSLMPEPERDFNFDLFYGSDIQPERILTVCRSYPMMSERRIVVVREFGKLRSSEEGGSPQDFVPYLERPNPATLLLLLDEKKPDKRTRLGKLLSNPKHEHVYSAAFDKLPDYRLPEWVEGWVSHRFKKSIEPRAVQMLIHLAGNRLRLLSTELEKVCTFVDGRERVTAEDVTAVTGSYREYSAIELKESIFARDLGRSLEIVEQMLQQRTSDTGEVIRTVGFFYSVFGNIWQILRLREKGLDKSRISKELGISGGWYFDQLWKDASAFRLSEMPVVFEALLDADRACKGFSTLDSSTILLLMVRRMIG